MDICFRVNEADILQTLPAYDAACKKCTAQMIDHDKCTIICECATNTLLDGSATRLVAPAITRGSCRARPARVYHGATRRRMDHRSLCVLRNPPELEHVRVAGHCIECTIDSQPTPSNVEASPPVAIDEDGDGVPRRALLILQYGLASRRTQSHARSSDRAELRHQLRIDPFSHESTRTTHGEIASTMRKK